MNLKKNAKTLVFTGLIMSMLVSGAAIYANSNTQENKKEHKNKEGVYIVVPKKMFDMMKGEKKIDKNTPKEFFIYTKDGKLQKLTSKNATTQTADQEVTSQKTREMILVPKSEFRDLMKEFKKNRPTKEQRKECKQKLLNEVKSLNLTELGYPAPEKVVFPKHKGKRGGKCGDMNKAQKECQMKNQEHQTTQADQ
ncbi:MAG TPA: hypothetical protein QF753_08980 [Victivallales bacterium]|nr:hypothetical protein [Victivallales bacterium]